MTAPAGTSQPGKPARNSAVGVARAEIEALLAAGAVSVALYLWRDVLRPRAHPDSQLPIPADSYLVGVYQSVPGALRLADDVAATRLARQHDLSQRARHA
ncbi:MAG: hypothetical protein ING52_14840 [Burkholderiales bacterium]|nr:hypothetical protein [Burkholderiales bacterium]MCE2646898.1 hypothetical protein [Burkholderiaceae bacterium]